MDVIVPNEGSSLAGSPSLRDRVVEKLQEAIFFGRLAPGKRLVETELADMLGVSRAPVREAINELRVQGLVSTIPRRGSYVRETTEQDVREIYEVRKAVELAAIQAALPSVDDADIAVLDSQIKTMLDRAHEGDIRGFSEADVEFHRLTYAKCPNRLLLGLAAQVATPSRMIIMRSLTVGGVNLVETAMGHQALRDAIASRDARTVEQVFGERFDHDARVLIDRLQRSDAAPAMAGAAASR
jgi:DNA-binding GntR family transcriptional regulator